MTTAGYSPGCIQTHVVRWRLHLLPFLKGKQSDNYSVELGRCFLENKLPSLSPSSQRRFKRSIRILNSYLSTGNIPKHSLRVPTPPLPGEIGAIVKDLIRHKLDNRCRLTTIEHYQRLMSAFIIGLSNKGKILLSDITEDDIVEFLNIQESNTSRFTILRQFYQYLGKFHPEKPNYGYVFEFTKPLKRSKLPSTYTAEEIGMLEKHVDRCTPLGKRTYAMILLASRLGLRISDIINLKFNNIDWDESVIKLVQMKTGKHIELPLLKIVGEAIVDYLKVRPECKSDTIFVTHNRPFSPMNRSGAGRLISNVFVGSGIDCSGRKHGPHSLRFSLGERLLENHVGLPAISETFGHSGSDVTMTYLRIDMGRLRECMMDVPPVNECFYEQQDGTFYI